ncbi:hypothetical protein PT110_09570 [Erysipelothrix rhusiopathiae]|nr:hypothetical protein [Erysipelothrix rhusiopathiae]
MADGANCFGYHLWTFVDCWSWLNGYRNHSCFSIDTHILKITFAYELI